MAAIPERRVSSVARWAKSIAGFSLVLFVTAGVGHRYGIIETVAFLYLLGLVASLAMLGLALAAGGFVQLWERGYKAGRASLAAALLSLLVLSPFIAGVYFVLRYPALTDISTDLVEPPDFMFAPRRRSAGMNAILPISPRAASLQLRFYPDVSGRRLDASMDRVLSALGAVVASRGWRLRFPLPASTASSELSIEAEAPTFLFRFPVDAVLRLTDEGESVFVDMRMNSRYGRHDLGDGARRIRRFMADLDAEFARQSLEIIDIPALPEEEDPVD